jgi:predicted nucleic acid-binding protein
MAEIETKDAPIVAGALAAAAGWIVSYDRRHLLNHRERILQRFSIRVGTPDEYLNR